MDFTISMKLFAALFAIMNPLTIIPVFLSLTADGSATERRSALTALVATVVVGFFVCALGGRWLLSMFGIEVADFQLAGGLIVLLLALSMLSGEDHSAHAGSSPEKARYDAASSVGVYPLGIPLAVGPGTMATIIVFASQAERAGAQTAFYLGLAAYAVFFSACMTLAPLLARALSPMALSISRRVMGIILAAIAAEMMVSALGRLFPAWLAR